jgi:hypothetical protein
VEELVAGRGSPYEEIDTARTRFFELEYPKTTLCVPVITLRPSAFLGS